MNIYVCIDETLQGYEYFINIMVLVAYHLLWKSHCSILVMMFWEKGLWILCKIIVVRHCLAKFLFFYSWSFMIFYVHFFLQRYGNIMILTYLFCKGCTLLLNLFL